MSLGVVIPSFKEAENIAKLSLEILKYVPDAYVLIVDDSPDDSCVKVIQELNQPNVQIEYRGLKSGRGSAVMTGLSILSNKGYQYILEMDADFSHPPSQIPELLNKAKSENSDMIIASRYLKESEILNWPFSRRIFSYTSNKIARFVLAVPTSDYTNGFRLYSLAAAQQILKSCSPSLKGFIALSDILVNLYYRGYSISEVPTRFVNRIRGESSLNYKEILHAIKGLWITFQVKQSLKKQHLIATNNATK